jgi:hypothetical protein
VKEGNFAGASPQENAATAKVLNAALLRTVAYLDKGMSNNDPTLDYAVL